MANGINAKNLSKRTADTEDLDGGEDSLSRLKKKARLRDDDEIEAIDKINNDIEELDFLQVRLRPKVAFRRPPSPPSIQQSEDSQFSSADLHFEKRLHSSQSQVGDDRDNPLVLEDDEGQDQSSGSDIDIDSQDDAAGLENKEGPDDSSGPTSVKKKESEVHMNNQDNSMVLEDDERSDPNSASQIDNASPKKGQDQCASPPKVRQGQRASVPHGEEREIEKIVGRRRTRRGYEYQVRWRDTWLLRSELGNAQGLVQQFDKELSSSNENGGK